MEIKIPTIIVLTILFLVSGKAQETVKDTTHKYSSSSTISEFWNQMDDIFNDPNFNNARWGVVIQSLKTGEYFYKRNANKLFMPASNLKLFTTASGLDLLGSDFRFKTNVYIKGKIDDHVLNGDLIIQGKGDPTISGRFYDNNMYKVYDDWADSLLKLGIDEIRGNIIGDDNAFDDVGLGAGWAWDYESYWFAAPSDAISFNDNSVDINVFIDKKTKQPQIIVKPDTKYIIILNKVKLAPKDSATSIDVYRKPGTNLITVFGTISSNSDTVKTFATVNNPTHFAMVVLKKVLEKKGIDVDGYPIDIDDLPVPIDYSKVKKIFTQFSPPLRSIIKVINKNSQNLYAEQLLKTLGLEFYGLGTDENGVKAEEKLFKNMGINPNNLEIVDGSGLSRLDLVTPQEIVTLLSYMYKNKNFIPFFNSLPIAGIDGTLGNRMQNSIATGRIRAKTGFLEGVESLSGYAFTADNEPVAFSIIVNNFTVPVKLAENIQDLVCLRLANFKRK